VVLPPREDQEPVVTPPAEEPTDPNTLPDDATLTPVDPPPAPPAGEPGSGQTPLPPPPALP
jgi:hypothetical protein